MNKLYFDTETTGLYDFDLPSDHPGQPHLVQLACLLEDNDDKIRAEVNIIIKPDGWNIPEFVVNIHGISDSIAGLCGVNLLTAAYLFNGLCYSSDILISHNIKYDTAIMRTVFSRIQKSHRINQINRFCTMEGATSLVKIPKKQGQGYKWPKLNECIKHFFNEELLGAHDAMVDVRACRRVYHAITD